MMLTRYITAFILLSYAHTDSVQAQGSDKITGRVDKASLPVPREKGQLFYLQRDPNTNTIVYSLNTSDGKLDAQEPVKAYWIRYAEKGQREDLTFLQENMAYGIHTKPDGEVYRLRIKAYKELLITVAKNDKTDQYEATVTVDNKRIVLDRIFVRIKGGSLFNPKIEYVEIKGRAQNGETITHQFEV